MKLTDLETALLKLGPSFKKSAAHATDALRLEIDDVDVTVIPDATNADRVTVCCLFGPVPPADMPEVLRGVVAQNVELMRQASTAAFGVSDGDLLYAFSTDVSGDPAFVQALGGVMRSAAAQALQWQQSL
jgi:hypothetical protein